MTAAQWIAYARKGVVAVGAALAQAAVFATPQSEGGSAITVTEWVGIAVAFVGAIGVYAVKNTTPADPNNGGVQ